MRKKKEISENKNCSKLPDPSEYSDCSVCFYYKKWKQTLVNCDKSLIPHPNCKDWKVKCINFKKI